MMEVTEDEPSSKSDLIHMCTWHLFRGKHVQSTASWPRHRCTRDWGEWGRVGEGGSGSSSDLDGKICETSM